MEKEMEIDGFEAIVAMGSKRMAEFLKPLMDDESRDFNHMYVWFDK